MVAHKRFESDGERPVRTRCPFCKSAAIATKTTHREVLVGIGDKVQSICVDAPETLCTHCGQAFFGPESEHAVDEQTYRARTS